MAATNSDLRNISLWINSSGIFALDQANELKGTDNSTIFNKLLTEGTYKWNCQAYDAASNNAFAANNFTLTIDLSNPTYNNFQNNATEETRLNGVAKWNLTLNDNYGLSYYVFAHNQSGTFVNQTFNEASGLSENVEATLPITLTRGKTICGKFWFNDSANNINQTNLSCFAVANTLPTITSVSLTPATPFTENDLNCTVSGFNAR